MTGPYYIRTAAAESLCAVADISMSDVSSTSLAIQTGQRNFTVSSGKSFSAGGYVFAVYTADATQWMYGTISSYSGTTLIVRVIRTSGSGTYDSWAIAALGGELGLQPNGSYEPLQNTNFDQATIAFDGQSGDYGCILSDTAANHLTRLAAHDSDTNLRSITFRHNDANRLINLAGDLTIPADPGADRILFWNNTDNVHQYLTPNTGLSISGTDLDVVAGTAAIADNAVTFAKMQNIATDRLIGRDTALSGDPEEISLDSTLEWTGSQSIRRAALTGDVTASAGSNSTTIANDAVTNAKAADMAQSTIKGRAAGAGTGDPTDLTAGQARTILNVDNFVTNTFTLTDDSATTVSAGTTVSSATVIVAVTIGNAAIGATAPSGAFVARVKGTAAAPVSLAWTDATNIAYTTGALTGTTGTDGRLTFSVNDDHTIGIENRLGASRIITLTIIGGRTT